MVKEGIERKEYTAHYIRWVVNLRHTATMLKQSILWYCHLDLGILRFICKIIAVANLP